MKAGAAPGQQNRIICVASLARPDRALGRSDSAGSAADNNDIAYRAVDNGSTESRFSASLSLGRAPRTRLNDPCHGLVQGKGTSDTGSRRHLGASTTGQPRHRVGNPQAATRPSCPRSARTRLKHFNGDLRHSSRVTTRPSSCRRTRADTGRIIAALETKLAQYPSETDLANGEAWL